MKCLLLLLTLLLTCCAGVEPKPDAVATGAKKVLNPCNFPAFQSQVTTLPTMPSFIDWKATGKPITVVVSNVQVVSDSIPDADQQKTLEDFLTATFTQSLLAEQRFKILMDARYLDRYEKGLTELKAAYPALKTTTSKVERLTEGASPDLIFVPQLRMGAEVFRIGEGASQITKVTVNATLQVSITLPGAPKGELKGGTPFVTYNKIFIQTPNAKQWTLNAFQEVAFEASQRFGTKLAGLVPLVGRVTFVKGSALIANVGTDVGVKPEECFVTFRRSEEKDFEGKPVTLTEIIGFATPTVVQPNQAQLIPAGLKDQAIPVAAGDFMITWATFTDMMEEDSAPQ